MNYERLYYRLVISRKLMNRSRSEGVYYEKHHINPKSFGGGNDEMNLVLLTAKEHLIAHLLLVKFCSGVFKKKMVNALLQMCNDGRRIRLKMTSRKYESFKKEVISLRKGYKHSEEAKLKIKIARSKQVFSEEAKAKKSKSLKGIPHTWLKGRPVSEEVKKKLSIAHKGKKMSKEAIEKTRKALLGRKLSKDHIEASRLGRIGTRLTEEHKEKLRKAMLGRKASEETRLKLSLVRKGKPNHNGKWSMERKIIHTLSKRGTTQSEEVKARKSNLQRGKKLSEGHKAALRKPKIKWGKVIHTETGKIYDNAGQAARETGVSYNTLLRALKMGYASNLRFLN